MINMLKHGGAVYGCLQLIFKASKIIKYVDGWSEGWGDGWICDRASVEECSW